MCLLVIAWQAHPRYRLVVAANRDEFHERPAAPLAKWPAPGDILAGRDLRANGTWLGLDRHRRFGVITNFRELQRPRPDAPSRGALIPEYLRGSDNAEAFLNRLAREAQRYSGFNLLLTDGDSLWYASNRAERFARLLVPGVYGLSNEFLDTPWPKLRRVRRIRATHHRRDLRSSRKILDVNHSVPLGIALKKLDRIRARSDHPSTIALKLHQLGIRLRQQNSIARLSPA